MYASNDDAKMKMYSIGYTYNVFYSVISISLQVRQDGYLTTKWNASCSNEP